MVPERDDCSRRKLPRMMFSAEVLARSGQLDDENRQFALRMTDFGRAMTGMIHDLLDFTRTRLGAGMPFLSRRWISAVFARRSSTSFEPPIPTAAFTSSRSVISEASGMLADSVRFCQIWSGNAIEHGDERGAIEVLAKSEGPKVVLTVTNQGPVIESSADPRGPRRACRSISPPAAEARQCFTTVTVTCDGYCAEWCTALWATTPDASS